MEERYKDVNRSYGHSDGQQEKVMAMMLAIKPKRRKTP
jgi:hypothetical protein